MPSYRVTGPQHAITAIRNELVGEAIEGVANLSVPRPAPAGLVERRPHGQMEVWELIVSFASGVGSNAAYDSLKALLAKHLDVRHVDEIDPQDPGGSDGDEDS